MAYNFINLSTLFTAWTTSQGKNVLLSQFDKSIFCAMGKCSEITAHVLRRNCWVNIVLLQGELRSRSTWAWLGCYLNLEARGDQAEPRLELPVKRVDGISEFVVIITAFPNWDDVWWELRADQAKVHLEVPRAVRSWNISQLEPARPWLAATLAQCELWHQLEISVKTWWSGVVQQGFLAPHPPCWSLLRCALHWTRTMFPGCFSCLRMPWGAKKKSTEIELPEVSAHLCSAIPLSHTDTPSSRT